MSHSDYSDIMLYASDSVDPTLAWAFIVSLVVLSRSALTLCGPGFMVKGEGVKSERVKGEGHVEDRGQGSGSWFRCFDPP
eukprot:1815144-Rhodomonas_salina.1